MTPPTKAILLVITLFLSSFYATLSAQGQLWGVAKSGLYKNGVLFVYDLTESTYTIRYHFKEPADGISPIGSLCQAPNGKLYGMTEYGGANNVGVVFEYDRTANTYTKKVEFDGPLRGARPQGSLIVGTNGKLYGLTLSGGSRNIGVLFEFDPSTDQFQLKHDFTNTLQGYNPRGSLIQASNGKLYGTASTGGSTPGGTLFSFDLSTNTFTKVYDFAVGSDGSSPWCDLTEAADGKLYGMAGAGGTSSLGVLFCVDPTINSYTKLHDFTGYPNGASPLDGRLTLSTNGKFYGIAPSGAQGEAGPGIIFEFDPMSKVYRKIHTFGNSDLQSGNIIDIFSGFTEAGEGSLYAMSFHGGSSQYGTLYKYNLQARTYTKLRNFSQHDGANPSNGYLTYLNKVEQSIAFDLPSDRVVGDTPLELVATASSGLAVSFSSSAPEIATIEGNVLTLHKAGETTITARQDGNAIWAAASELQLSLRINKASQSLQFSPITEKYVSQESFLLEASASSGLPITFSVTKGQALASIDPAAPNLVKLSGQVGDVEITATQAGDENTLAATLVQPFNVVADPVLSTGAAKNTSGVKVHPNPAEHWVHVSADQQALYTISLIDVFGQQVFHHEMAGAKDYSLLVNHYPPGLYFLKILLDNGSYSIRRIILR